MGPMVKAMVSKYYFLVTAAERLSAQEEECLSSLRKRLDD